MRLQTERPGSSVLNKTLIKALFPILAIALFTGWFKFKPFEGDISAIQPYADPSIALKVGEAAPDFSLSDAEGNTVSLSDFKGDKGVLLLFYRGSWCPYCVSHLEDIQNLLPSLDNYGVQFLAVSPDKAAKSAKLAKKFARPYVFLADEDLAVAEAYGIKKDSKLPHPAVFLIDREGNVVWYHVDQNYKKRASAVQIKEVLDANFSASAESLSDAFAAAAAGDHRSAENVARNKYRHPVETLEFFGIKPGMTVLEISPGGMWYTEILAPALKGKGQFIVAGYDVNVEGQPEYRYRQQKAMEQRFIDQPEIYSEVKVVPFSPPDSVQLGEDDSVDVVVTFRNFHGWLRGGIAESNLQAFFDVLKPGGTLGLVQHRADVSAKQDPERMTGYVTEQRVIELAESVGFELDEKSEINANPLDTRDHPAGVWTLPPVLRLGEQDREKYLAIGESDRMTLRFRKPE